MGLDVSHDAFHGAYSAFDRFRWAICKAMGGSWPPHESEIAADGEKLIAGVWYWGRGFTQATHPGLHVLLTHSDCDGDISPEDCALVAKDLEQLLPDMAAMGTGGGHIARAGGYGEVTRKFIAGCLQAAAENEPLQFG